MLKFPIQLAEAITCTADWSRHDHANLTFLSEENDLFPFHLAVRKDEKAVVANSFGRDGWQGECRIEIPGFSATTEASIRLLRDDDRLVGLEIAVDRVPVACMLANAFEGLDQVIGLRHDSAIIPETVAITLDPSHNVQLWVDGDLRINGWVTDAPQAPARLELLLPGDTVPLPLTAKPLDGPLAVAADAVLPEAREVDAPIRRTFLAGLPGRIWTAIPESEPALVQLRVNGRTACKIPVTRGEIVRAIEMATSNCDIDGEPYRTLTALEHVRFGGIWEVLSQPAREFCLRAAARFNVTEFLLEGLEPDNATRGEAPRIELAAAQELGNKLLDCARSEILDLLWGGKLGYLPVVASRVLTQYALDNAQAVTLVQELTEECIHFGVMDELIEIARPLPPITATREDTNWSRSIALPFLLARGEVSLACDLLWSLEPDADWVTTPAVGWFLSEIIDSTGKYPVDPAWRNNAIYAYFDLVKRMSASYWGRARCSSLIVVAAQLVRRRGAFPDFLQQEVESFVAHYYGLSREFWDHLEEVADVDLGLRLAAARGNFRDVLRCIAQGPSVARRVVASPIAIPMAAASLNWKQPVDGDRIVRELMLERRSTPDNSMHAEEILRLAAGPSGGDLSPVMTPAVREVLRRLHTNIPTSEYYSLQKEVSAEALAAFTKIRKNQPIDAVQFDAMMGHLELLNGPENRWLGLDIALLLFSAFTDAGRNVEAGRTVARLLPATYRAASATALSRDPMPAVRAALAQVELANSRKPDPLRTATLDLLGTTFGFDKAPLPASDTASACTPAAEFFDTIVVIMTCKRYIDDRVAAVRKSYVTRLQELGIPYVFVVGGGDGSQVGDVVYLDCPDDYEHLPQKTLKAIEWVHRNTSSAFMLKIDDDCFLNVDEFMLSRSYRKFDYYGRRIYRSIGTMDRTWHMAKSSSPRGRMELDKSPEPSAYADGGSGYCVSRHAMGAILDAVSSLEGMDLVRESFMEDKMVGDLLHLRGIELSFEDCYVSVLRKTSGSRVPVSMYQNSFYASSASATKIVHIDGSELQEEVSATLHGNALEPRKIWPTYAPITIGDDSNVLELVSSRETCERLARAPLVVVACVRNEAFMLPSFLAHYRKLGIDSFIISDNCSSDGTLDYLLEQPDVVVFSCDTQYKKSVYGVAWQQAMLANFRTGRWTIVADADELLVYPGHEHQSLNEFIANVDAEGADSVTCMMLDMYPRGLLQDATFEDRNPFDVAGYADRQPFRRGWKGHGPYFNSLTWTSALRHRLMPNSKPDEFVAQKACILKYVPWMQLSAGLHYVGDRRSSRDMAVLAHFKYHAAFKAKVVAEVQRGQHFGDAAEYQRYISLLAEGRDTLFDEAISVPWAEADMVRDILKMPERSSPAIRAKAGAG